MTEAHVIDASVAAAPLVEIIVAVATLLIGWGVKVLRDKFKIDENGRLNELINDAINSGMNYAFHQLEKKKQKLTFETENEFVAHATNYILNGVPTALKLLGVTKEHVTEMVEARLAGKMGK